MIINFAFSALMLVLASAVDIALTKHIYIGGAGPDVTLVIAILLATRTNLEAAAIIGFFTGLFHSAATNDRLFAFVVAGIAACMTGTKICSRAVEATPMTIAVVVSLCTAISRAIVLFIGLPTSPDNIFPWLPATIGTAIYNGVIAIPAFLLVKRLSQTLLRT